MTIKHIRFGLAASAAVMPWGGIAVAQQTPAPPPAPTEAAAVPDAEIATDDAPEIEVVGQRERGAVPGDIPPVVQYDAAAIRSYGVSSVAELLTALSPQTTSARGREGGRPVVLLNGRRISGFQEIRDLPTEAIERVDILPEEAALRLGYRADQRVVNFVLRRRFNAITGEVQGGGATGGDRFSAQGDANLLRISRDRRFTINLHYDGATPIYESDRDIERSAPTRPFGIAGNLTGTGAGREIDPRLSALAGSTVTVAGVPGGLTERAPLSAFTLPAEPGNVGAFRTLSAGSRVFSTNATYSRTILGNITASINATVESTATDSALGLASGSLTIPAGNPFSPFGGPVVLNRYFIEAGPRLRDVDLNTAHAGVALNGDVGAWRWSFNGNYDRTLTRTTSDASLDLAPLATRLAAGDATVNPFNQFRPGLLGDYARDFARSLTNVGNGEVVASGPVATLPGGPVAVSLKSGFETVALDASAIRSGVATAASLGRDDASAQASVDVPIASRRTGFLDAIGNLSLNANYAINTLSDFGRLSTTGYGINWSPIPAIRLIASVTDEQGAPTINQLGDPVVVTPDARVFDFVTGTSVDITRVDGGNRALRADDRHVAKLGLNLRPFGATDLSLSADYVRTRTLDPIASFPAATAAIEAAFPDRFTRDAGGRLLRIDNRPVNFNRRDEEQLRWGVNFSQRIGPVPPPRGAGGFGGGPGAQRPDQRPDQPAAPRPDQPDAPATAPAAGNAGPAPGGGRPGGFGGGPRGFGGPGGFGGGRLELSVYHTLRLEDRITIRPGVPVLDLLDGFALTNRGGQPRNTVEVQAGIIRNGLGARLNGTWQQATQVQGGTAAIPNALAFSPLTTLTLRLFANFQPNMTVVRQHPWLRGTRVTFTVQNLFDTRLRVTDGTGTVPLNYQPDLLDPIGRTVRIGIRKLFF